MHYHKQFFLFKKCIFKICFQKNSLQKEINKLKQQNVDVQIIEKKLRWFSVHLYKPYIKPVRQIKIDKSFNLKSDIRVRELIQKCFKVLDLINLKIKKIQG